MALQKKIKIFIGSSSEAGNTLDTLAYLLAEYKCEPVRWDKPGLFLPGENTFLKLQELCTEVDAAIFIFSQDDKIWYRKDAAQQPRDNVLIEYGMFSGALGKNKAIFVVDGFPRLATDILGIQYVDISEERIDRAKLELKAWVESLRNPKLSSERAKDLAKIHDLKSKLSIAEEEARFYKEIASEKSTSDAKETYHKALENFDFVFEFSQILSDSYNYPSEWFDFLKHSELDHLTNGVEWESYASDGDRSASFIRKTFRVIRRYEDSKVFEKLVSNLIKPLRVKFDDLVKEHVE